MSEKIKKYKVQIKSVSLGITIGLIIGSLIMFLFQNDKIESLIITTGPKGIPFSLEIKSKQIQDSILLESLWKHDYTRDGLIGWFKQKGFVSMSNDIDIIAENIKKMSPTEDLAKRIITFKNNKEGPFQILSDSAVISVPEYNVPRGTANTWEGSKYAGQKIILADPNYKQGTLNLVCNDSKMGARPASFRYRSNFFHVNKEDFNSLLGDKSTKGVVYISVSHK